MRITYTVPEFRTEFDPDTEVFCPKCGNVAPKPDGYTPQTFVICKTCVSSMHPNGVPMVSMEEAFSLAEDYPWYRKRFDVDTLNGWYERTMVAACCSIIGDSVDPDAPKPPGGRRDGTNSHRLHDKEV